MCTLQLISIIIYNIITKINIYIRHNYKIIAIWNYLKYSIHVHLMVNFYVLFILLNNLSCTTIVLSKFYVLR